MLEWYNVPLACFTVKLRAELFCYLLGFELGCIADCKAAMQGMADHQQLQGGQVGPAGLVYVQVCPLCIAWPRS